jgi:hypothetical protein
MEILLDGREHGCAPGGAPLPLKNTPGKAPGAQKKRKCASSLIENPRWRGRPEPSHIA